MKDDDLRVVARLLDEMLQLPEDDWPAWLERQTGLTPEQQARLRQLMAAELRGACTLPPLPEYSAADLAAQDRPDLHAGLEGGPYRLLRELGCGGMGSVWLAERSDGTLKRQVALKLPHASLQQRQFAERFGRERDILAALVHPNIARLYDAGLTEQGRPYLALELVEGLPLLEYCRDRQLGLPARLALFEQILLAIQYAHGQLIVHRDLKPSNIYVTHAGEVRLLDFGIAKLLGEGQELGSPLTEFGGHPLTLQYAAPEQILGQAIGTATDVYSLGVVLYELLTGALPYRLRRDTRLALEDAIMAADVVPASQAARQMPESSAWARELKGDLDTIVLKALRKDPADRYATAAAFADDIERYLKGKPVQAQADSAWYRGRKFLGRHRLGAAMTMLVVVALAAGLGVALWQAELARREARTATAVKDFMRDIFVVNSSQQADPAKARETTARELLDIGAAKLDAALEDAPDAKQEMLKLFVEIYSQLGLADKALEFAQRRVTVLRNSQGADSPELVKALLVVAMTLRSQSIDQPGQDQAIGEATLIVDRLGGTDAELRSLVLAIAAEYFADYDFPRAVDYAHRSLVLGHDSTEFAALAERAATIDLQAGNFAGSQRTAEDGIAAALSFNAEADSGEGGYIQLPGLRECQGLSRWAMDDLAGAEEYLRRALTAARATFGETDLESLRIQSRLADLLLTTGRRREGEEMLRQASEALARSPANSSARLMFGALASIGRAQAHAGHYAAALAALSRARAMRGGITASPAVAEILRDQARVMQALDRLTDARAMLDQAIAMRTRSGLNGGNILQEEADLHARLGGRATE